MIAFLKWFSGVVAAEVTVQLIAVTPVAYLLGWTVECAHVEAASPVGPVPYMLSWEVGCQKGIMLMPDTLPPSFLPILMMLILGVTFYPAFIAPFVKRRRKANKRKGELLRHTYWMVKHAITPAQGYRI